jgi:hypothetical protein
MRQKELFYIFTFALFIGTVTQAQDKEVRNALISKYDKSASGHLFDKIKTETKIDRQKVLEYRKLYGVELKKASKGGRLLELKQIDDFGTPIYYTTFNEGARITSQVDALQEKKELGVELFGQNMIVAIIDGQTAFLNHQEFLGEEGSKIRVFDPMPSLEKMDDNELEGFQNSKLHATHVAGTVGALGINSKARGVASQANIWSYNWDDDILKLTEIGNQGILVSNHSYGISAIDDNKTPLLPEYYFGAYTRDAQNFDEVAFVFPFLQPVVAAGNDRQDYGIINPQKSGNDLLLGAANAKNVIVVGAVKEVTKYEGVNSVVMSDFSSFGPTNDFRIKPDVVAKGVDVFSSIYINPQPLNSNPVNNYYGVLSGTSMATPVVSGIILLWQQWAIENKNMPYKASTIKAIAIHTADKAGNVKGPDHKFGWGLINAKNGVVLMKSTENKNAFIEENTLLEGEVFIQKIEINEEKEKVMFTLAWTDPAGDYSVNNFEEEVNVHNLINDLDIKVIKEGTEYLPWKLNKDFLDPYPLKGNNDSDNVEKIEIENAGKGVYTVEISHKHNLKYKHQDFSLIISDQKFGGISVLNKNEVVKNQIEIWPNPISEYINVQIPSEYALKDLTVAIFDINGKLVKKKNKIKTTTVIISTIDLDPGIYIVKISEGGLDATRRIIKK